MIHIRAAISSDVAMLVAVDTFAAIDPRRAEQIAAWVEDGSSFVATIDGAPVGYSVLHHHFFEQAMLELVMVAEAERGKGIGERLVRYAISICDGPQLWTSTNASNLPMQRLLDRLGFIASGHIEGLDEGDSELIYRIATPGPTAPPFVA